MIGRPPRAGKTTKRRSFRTTDAEWSHWKRAARCEGCATLSSWAIQTLNARAEGVAPSNECPLVIPEALTREMVADLMARADARVTTDCQAFLAGRGGKAKRGQQLAAHVASSRAKAPPSGAWIHDRSQHKSREPMTAERLAQIEALCGDPRLRAGEPSVGTDAPCLIPELLAEVQRLRAECTSLKHGA